MKLGVIGYGRRIRNLIELAFRSIRSDLRVVGIVDPDETGVRTRLNPCDQEGVKFYPDLDEMMRKAKPDALAIGTRCHQHAPYAIEAARYDVPLFLEKPVATSMEQAVALEKAFETGRCPVVVSFPLRVSPLCMLARQFLQDGAVGSAEHILGVNYVPYGIVYWETNGGHYPSTQGLFLQKATHDFDYMEFLMGSRIVRVGAMANYGRVFGGKKPSGLVCSRCAEQETCPESPQNRRRNASTARLDDHLCNFSADSGSPETGMHEDCSSAVLEFASGAHGLYTQVFFSRRDAAMRGATISGYSGTVSFDWYRNELKRVRHHAPFTDIVKAGEGSEHFGGDKELGEDFVGLVRGTRQSRTPIESGIQSAYACLAAKESAETGRFVKVRQVGGTP